MLSVFDLISVFREILERAKKRPQMEIHREEVTVGQMIEHVKQILTASSRPVSIEQLMSGYESRQALIALFLALLELVRLHAVLLRQKDLYSSIMVHRHKRFEDMMSGASYESLQAGLDKSLGDAPESSE